MRFDKLLQGALETWKLTASKEFDGKDVILLFVGNALGGEVGELQNKITKYFKKRYSPAIACQGLNSGGIGERLVDTIKDLLKLSKALNINAESAFEEKMKVNRERYRLKTS